MTDKNMCYNFVVFFVNLNYQSIFSALDPKLSYLKETLDVDGLPFPGTIINPGEPYYW